MCCLKSGLAFMWWIGAPCGPGSGFYRCSLDAWTCFVWIGVSCRIRIRVHVVDWGAVWVGIGVIWVRFSWA